jgi:rRNA processing protein Gar1
VKRNWVKLNLFYIGKSKKHQIFRAKQWNRNLEKVFRQPVYNEKYEKVGYVKDIFGPIDFPFISIKALPDQHFDTNLKVYTKLT